ncbi:hypothetical protein MRB53_011714 [Persea americana]|uniref:Uncharacterized protein n=1 Tax=Persea americana TaxID=3435 RepID=A0ACC2LVK3_PERAE|nr:hypothetical protein MRB53_011714 [Persea americana]
MSSTISLRESTVVRPSAQTPGGTLWLSNMDLVMPRFHVPYIYFYRPSTGSTNFFDPRSLRRALSNALVFFYPLAGRLKTGEDGCLAIDCNGEGALFIEAVTDSVIDDFGDFAPTVHLLKLSPKVDYSNGISSYPLFLVQVTYFKCGGVSLMVLVHHSVADGTASFHFINTWSELARGLSNPSLLPSIHRAQLQANNPPTPFFHHQEYQAPPSLNTPPPQTNNSNSTAVSIFNISAHQLHLLKSKTKEESHGITYTTFETLAAHIWRCVCKARGIPDNQETKLYIPVNGRKRLQPTLSEGYFGNVLFTATPVAVVGDLMRSGSLSHAAGIIHGELGRMDNEYLRSAVDYLEQVRTNIETAMFGSETFRSPNLRITSWYRMPIHEADFGWGRPVFTGMGIIPFEGMCFVIPNPIESGSDDGGGGGGNGGISLAISLQPDHMNRFGKLLYEF